jgi:SWI/SNF-related matrix-associated actin-dependent regulator of chromatin subfamily A3
MASESADAFEEALRQAAAERETCVGSFTTDCVGCRYYAGVVHAGEFVTLVREPHNEYDANAVRVDNLSGTQVGHINRHAAVLLAQLLDDGSLSARVEASAPYPARSVFTVPVLLSVFAPPETAERVRAILGGRLTPQLPAAPAAASPRAASVVSRRSLETRGHTSQADLDGLLSALEAAQDNTPPFDAASAPALFTQLFPHQAAGVAWMLQRERNPDNVDSGGLPPFWSRAPEGGFLNEITMSGSRAAPSPVRGGALFDDMGLGKSLQTLAVLCANAAPPAAAAAGPAADAADLEDLSLKQLKALAAKAGVPVSGTKAALATKLRDSRAASTASPAPGDRRATLIVCPVSVVASWEDQIATHLAPGSLKVHTYLGAARNPDPVFLASCDVVLTSYATLGGDLEAQGGTKRKRPSGLLAVQWRRCVLDEAHTVRNRATRAARACLTLDADLRWCLTGTPITNKSEDVFTLLAFLRAAPLADWAVFSRSIARPLREGDPAALARLRLLLRTLSLRRTKALLASRLPPKTVEVRTVRLDAASRDAYDCLFDSARGVVRAALASGGDGSLLAAYTGVLECILRLRQAADATSLVPPARLAAARAVAQRFAASRSALSPAQLSGDEVKRLFAALAGALGGDVASAANADADAAPTAADAGAAPAPLIDEAGVADDCAVCLEALTEESARVLRACRHALCDDCLGRLVAAGGHVRCPLCRAPFAASDILSKAVLLEAAGSQEPAAAAEAAPADAAAGPPPKALALLEALCAMRASDGDAKAVVFSQFTSFIDLLGPALAAAGFACARLDGSMAADARRAQLASFRRPNAGGGPRVLLASTRAAGVGLNLTETSHVFLMDVWWNAATDEQAMDRVHRLGQTRPVSVVRFIGERTIEENILALQARKAALGAGALRRLTAEEARAGRAAELRSLFDV